MRVGKFSGFFFRSLLFHFSSEMIPHYNRVFWPVRCNVCDNEGIAAHGMDFLFFWHSMES